MELKFTKFFFLGQIYYITHFFTQFYYIQTFIHAQSAQYKVSQKFRNHVERNGANQMANI